MGRFLRAAVLILVVGALLAAVGPAANAKGWSGPWYYLPGENWHGRTEVRFGSVHRLRDALKTDYFVYLREATPLFSKGQWRGVADVSLSRHPDDERILVAETLFELPDLPLGRYMVTFCTLGCKGSLGRYAPVFHVNVVADEAQRGLFYWLDDWLQMRRGLRTSESEIGRVASMSDMVRRNDNAQQWRLRSLSRRVHTLEATEPAERSLLPTAAIAAIAGGALGWAGARTASASVAGVRKRRGHQRSHQAQQ